MHTTREGTGQIKVCSVLVYIYLKRKEKLVIKPFDL